MTHPGRSVGHGLPWIAVCQEILYIVDITKLWLTFYIYISIAVLFIVIKYQRLNVTPRKLEGVFF
jgi:hypothetical protein